MLDAICKVVRPVYNKCLHMLRPVRFASLCSTVQQYLRAVYHSQVVVLSQVFQFLLCLCKCCPTFVSSFPGTRGLVLCRCQLLLQGCYGLSLYPHSISHA